MKNNLLRTAIVYGLLTWAVIIIGCASVGKFTPGGAQWASNAVTTAQSLLSVIDGGLYATLLGLKNNGMITGNEKALVTATRQLAGLDKAAELLKAVIAGATVTDEELNKVAGQVDGAKAIIGSK